MCTCMYYMCVSEKKVYTPVRHFLTVQLSCVITLQGNGAEMPGRQH